MKQEHHQHGVPFATPAGRAVRYEYLEPYEHGDAIKIAVKQAVRDGHKVLDVNSAVAQPYGGWIVELAIR